MGLPDTPTGKCEFQSSQALPKAIIQRIRAQERVIQKKPILTHMSRDGQKDGDTATSSFSPLQWRQRLPAAPKGLLRKPPASANEVKAV